ncbi:hypothetical protein SAMN05880566_12826 [Janthinobacterium sp. TND4EL3]|nr:hypothetical protein SAMN05880566_12826 [Janthinobacterium sp. TND4EL3]
MEEKTGKPAVKECPMLFSAPMVRALLDGRKTQTRRIVKPQPFREDYMAEEGVRRQFATLAPYGQPGDRIWVRETFQGPLFDGERMDEYRSDSTKFETPEFCVYAADGGGAPEFQDADDNLVCRWRPSIHMPRWASRIQLEIVSVRVERLNDCSQADALAEGVAIDRSGCHFIDGTDGRHVSPVGASAVEAFASLWESINGAGSWAANPWVWVVEFKRVAP